MVRCTNCNEVLPFKKVAFLSKRKNIVECQKCHTVLEGDEKQLGIIGGISGGAGGLLGFLTVYSFPDNIGLAALFFIVSSNSDFNWSYNSKSDSETKTQEFKRPTTKCISHLPLFVIIELRNGKRLISTR
jgi:hypothetical protein